MTRYTTPGSYIERRDASSFSISTVRTDICGFVGIAREGPIDTPVAVESYRQFVSHFGEFTGAGYLGYVVKAFFENGGRRCWIVRVAHNSGAGRAQAAYHDIADIHGNPALRVSASSEGIWGEQLAIRVLPQFAPQTHSVSSNQTDLFTTVSSVTGFERGSLVELSQPGVSIWRVVAHIDPHKNRLYWNSPDSKFALPYERKLDQLDLSQPIYMSSLSYRFQVFRNGRLISQLDDISLIPEHPRFVAKLMAPFVFPTRLAGADAIPEPPLPVIAESLADPSLLPAALDDQNGEMIPLQQGADGLSELGVVDFIGLDFIGQPQQPLQSDEVKQSGLRGIRALLQIQEISVASIPDILIQPQQAPEYEPVIPVEINLCISCPPPPEPRAKAHQPSPQHGLPPIFSDDQIYQVQGVLVELCERRKDCFALLDVPFNYAQEHEGTGALQNWRQRFDSDYAALYFPWFKVLDDHSGQQIRTIPACGHVAGQYAHHDNEVGVHKAPANRTLSWIQDVTVNLDFERHGIMNSRGINITRVDPGRGLRIMGARTLSSDPDWKYVNVRRLMMMIRKSVDLATQWVAFEPNNYQTRSRVTLTLNSFLLALWQRGALRGEVAEQAFFVQCDELNNPPEQRANGQLLAEVGVAPSVPFEFVVLRVGRQGEELQITESNLFARAA